MKRTTVSIDRYKGEKMKERLFWRLRDGIFAMDKRGYGFPSMIAERVCKYAPRRLKEVQPILLAELVKEFGEVLGHDFSFSDCKEAISFELGCELA